MPTWLITVILNAALPVVVQWLLTAGHQQAAEALIAKGSKAVAQEVRAAKQPGAGNA